MLKKLLIKVVDLANSFPPMAERFLYVKKQLRYKAFKKARFDENFRKKISCAQNA